MNNKHIVMVFCLIIVVVIIILAQYLPGSLTEQRFGLVDQIENSLTKLQKEKQAVLNNSQINAKAKDKMVAYLSGELKAKTPNDRPKQAQQFYKYKRMNAAEEIPIEKYLAASSQFSKKVSLSGIIAPTNNSSLVPDVAPGTFVWNNIGPGNVGGRTRAILVQGTSPNYTIYAGGVAGGVWKSTDGGTSWTALDDLMPNLAVTTLVQDPNNDSVIYAGTGEGFSNIDSVRGAGVFKTTDGGNNWNQISATNTSDFYYVNQLHVSPNNSNIIYAATRTGIHKSDTSGDTWMNIASGIFSSRSGYLDLAVVNNGGIDYLYAWNSYYGLQVSIDGGSNWFYRIGGGVISSNNYYRGAIAISQSDPGTAYVSVSTYSGRLYNLYKTIDYFSNVTTPIILDTSTAGRINAILLSNSYYSLDTGSGNNCAGGVSGGYNQGWYDNVIAVDPTNANCVFVGGIDLFRSDNGGETFQLASEWGTSKSNARYLHADHHAIVFAEDYDGDSETKMFLGNDGGIYQSTDLHNGVTSTNVCNPTDIGISYLSLNNGYGVTQFYHGAVPTTGTRYIAGAQDNGTQRYISGTTWSEIRGGDGGYTAVSPNTSDILYSAYVNISIRRSNDGGNSFMTNVADLTKITSGGSGLHINPYVIDPTTPNVMFLTNQYLWRSTNVEDANPTWSRLGYLGGKNGSAIGIPPIDYLAAVVPVQGPINRYYTLISDINHMNFISVLPMLVIYTTAIMLLVLTIQKAKTLKKWGIVITMFFCIFFFPACASEENNSPTTITNSTDIGTIYVGTNDGKLFALVGDSLSERTTGLPAGYISSVTVHPADHGIVYVTFSTFGVKHLWKTSNAGGTWNSLDSGGIPDIPVHSLFIDPMNTDHLYLGTDLGVLYSGDGGSTWESINTEGMANVVVEHLDYQHSSRRLFAFTHGRGVFHVTLP
jgi:photosystem II stability/assembly factor-like uncharacterized protein